MTLYLNAALGVRTERRVRGDPYAAVSDWIAVDFGAMQKRGQPRVKRSIGLVLKHFGVPWFCQQVEQSEPQSAGDGVQRLDIWGDHGGDEIGLREELRIAPVYLQELIDQVARASLAQLRVVQLYGLAKEFPDPGTHLSQPELTHELWPVLTHGDDERVEPVPEIVDEFGRRVGFCAARSSAATC